jgi:lysophospholipase L1-like esterase
MLKIFYDNLDSNGMRSYQLIIAILSLFLTMTDLGAQDRGELNKIATSQGTASQLLFSVDLAKEELIAPGDFTRDDECVVRGGMPNFFAKVSKGQDVTVAFIGGSLTQANYCYRMQISTYLQAHYPSTRFKWINAGVSGTGTDLGAFRTREQVLSHNPDLVIIDFAVNGAYAAGMEGMVRQIIQHNQYTDICLIYAFLAAQTNVYNNRKIPPHIEALEALADHYRIPTIHLGMEIARLESQNKLLWKGDAGSAGERILFSTDGIHPLKAGGDLYAAAIARGIEKMKGRSQMEIHPLPQPLISDEWDSAGMYIPTDLADFDVKWAAFPTAGSKLRAFDGWFDSLMVADEKGARFSFTFEGDLFGLFDIGGPEVGQLEVWVDGHQIKLHKSQSGGFQPYQMTAENHDNILLNRFNAYCNNRYRGQYDVIKVPKGKHEVSFRISPLRADKKMILGPSQQEDIDRHPEKYDSSKIYLGRILLRGTPILKIAEKEKG